MTQASVVGVRMTTFGPQDRTLAKLVDETATDAIDDAGVSNDRIEAFYFGNALSGMTENQTHLAPKLASHVGISRVPAQRFEDACATSSNALKHAVQAVEAGIHDVVPSPNDTCTNTERSRSI